MPSVTERIASSLILDVQFGQVSVFVGLLGESYPSSRKHRDREKPGGSGYLEAEH